MATSWMACAGLAVTGAAVAMSVLGNHLLGPNTPMTQAQVAQRLADHPGAAQGPAAAATAGPAASPGASASWPTARTFPGGTVYASCNGGQATLDEWSLSPGFRTTSVAAGPAAIASVQFASDTRAMLVTVTCPDTHPQFSSKAVQADAVTSAGTPGPTLPPATGAAGDAGGGGKGGSGRGSGGGGGGESGGEQGSGHGAHG